MVDDIGHQDDVTATISDSGTLQAIAWSLQTVGGHTTNSPLGIPVLSGAAFISLPQQWAAFEREQLCKQVQQSVTLGGR